MEANKNTPAFPVKIHESERLNEYKLLGLTKREMFAMAAMQGAVAQYSDPKEIAMHAVQCADELLKQLDHGSK
jgi:hypothetical protein